MTRRVIEFTGPDIVLMNRERNMHWAEVAEAVAEWQEAAFYRAAEVRLPKGLTSSNVASRLVIPASRPGPLPDCTSWFPTVKAIVDGLVRRGTWPDDNPKWIRSELYVAPVREEGLSHAKIQFRIDSDD